MDAKTLARFEAKVHVEPNSGCWIWRASLGSHGYGQLGVHDPQNGVYNRAGLAHRLSYEHFRGPIPEGLHLDHLCRTRECCNPNRLEAVTQGENNRRRYEGRLKTHCKHGHEFTPENTFPLKPNGRGCHACANRRRAAYDQRAKTQHDQT